MHEINGKTKLVFFYYLHILHAFGAANQQLVVRSQALSVKLSQQDHLQINHQKDKMN